MNIIKVVNALVAFQTETGPEIVNMSHIIKTIMDDGKVTLLLTDGYVLQTDLGLDGFIEVLEGVR